MEAPVHSFSSLFDQLGLDSSDAGIEEFVEKNGKLPAEVELHKANFWNEGQASFLSQVVEADADWVDIVNQLDASLR